MTCPKPHCEVGRWGEWPLGTARDGVLGTELFENNFLPQHGISTSQRPRRQPEGKVLQLSRDPSLGPRTSHPSNARRSASRSRRLSRTIDWFSPPGVAERGLALLWKHGKDPERGEQVEAGHEDAGLRAAPAPTSAGGTRNPNAGSCREGRGSPPSPLPLVRSLVKSALYVAPGRAQRPCGLLLNGFRRENSLVLPAPAAPVLKHWFSKQITASGPLCPKQGWGGGRLGS